jgi:glycosyltransferase involved in cell wall biosynthesis
VISIIVPTISGREESLARTIAAYEDTLRDVAHELIVIEDNPTWPGACNEGAKQAQGDILHFTADDLEPLPGWYRDVLSWMNGHDELPAAKVLNVDGTFDNHADGADGSIVWFTRVPIMRKDQYERIGHWPEMYHYADVWLSEKARALGIETRIFYSYAFVHHWSQIGRQEYTGLEWDELNAARATI